MGGLDEVRVSLASVASGLGVAFGTTHTQKRKKEKEETREAVEFIHIQLCVVDRILHWAAGGSEHPGLPHSLLGGHVYECQMPSVAVF